MIHQIRNDRKQPNRALHQTAAKRSERPLVNAVVSWIRPLAFDGDVIRALGSTNLNHEGVGMRLDKRLQAFNEKRGALLDEMGTLDPAKLAAKPLAGKWSILEIIEHLVLAERAVLQGLPEPSRLSERARRLKHRLTYVVVMFVLKYGIPVEVPSPAMVPRGDHSLGELRHMWDENQVH